MVQAFVLVKTTAGAAEGLVERIRAVPQVQEAHIVAGEYDIVAEIEVAEVYEVLDAVAGDVRSLDGVADTRTYMSLT